MGELQTMTSLWLMGELLDPGPDGRQWHHIGIWTHPNLGRVIIDALDESDFTRLDIIRGVLEHLQSEAWGLLEDGVL